MSKQKRRVLDSNVVEPDYRSVQLRELWEKVCKPMGYPDPRQGSRMYQSTSVKDIDSKRSSTDLQIETSQLGMGRPQITTRKILPRKIAIIPYCKVLFTDLRSEDQPEQYLQLQYGIRKLDDGDISMQKIDNIEVLFKDGDGVHVVTNPNLAMFLDICGQCQDSPGYLGEKEQAALGFRLEIMTPIKETSRLFKTVGFEKTTSVPKKIKGDNTKLIEAQVTMAGAARIQEFGKGFGMEVAKMRDQDIRAALYAKAADPSTHSIFMEMISSTRAEAENDVTAAEKQGLLVFGDDMQWYLKHKADQVEKPSLLNGTMMVDCMNSEGEVSIDSAKHRLVDIMVGSATAAPRTDITRAIRESLKKEFIRREVFDSVAVATGHESHEEILKRIAEFIANSEIYLAPSANNTKIWKWGVDDGSNATIITIKEGKGTALEQLCEHVTDKGLTWLTNIYNVRKEREAKAKPIGK